MIKEDLIPNYTPVRLVHNPTIIGFTEGICIRGKKMDIIEYNFTYWAGLDRKTEWVSPKEIEPIPEKETTGFRKVPNVDKSQTLLT